MLPSVSVALGTYGYSLIRFSVRVSQVARDQGPASLTLIREPSSSLGKLVQDADGKRAQLNLQKEEEKEKEKLGGVGVGGIYQNWSLQRSPRRLLSGPANIQWGLNRPLTSKLVAGQGRMCGWLTTPPAGSSLPLPKAEVGFTLMEKQHLPASELDGLGNEFSTLLK